MDAERLDPAAASRKAGGELASLFAGWRDPLLRRATASGQIVPEKSVPLRAMVAYLFGEVAKCLYLVHHPDQWIEYVTRSQGGDRCREIGLFGVEKKGFAESNHVPRWILTWFHRGFARGRATTDMHPGNDDA